MQGVRKGLFVFGVNVRVVVAKLFFHSFVKAVLQSIDQLFTLAVVNP